YTVGHEHHALTPKATRDAWWHALAGILSYDWTDRFNTSVRGEGFFDPQGARTGGLNATRPVNHVSLAELTLTGAYKFTAKLLGRAEVRQDVANKSVFKEGGGSADKAQTTFALQGIYTF
ncbi:MAG TPA: outer membrane beta-barrel protein, partial [Verrucomicrobiae bacterium]|nr:outer membrane beta-barrel protein [Verrucomicrobiae bacterium]